MFRVLVCCRPVRVEARREVVGAGEHSSEIASRKYVLDRSARLIHRWGHDLPGGQVESTHAQTQIDMFRCVHATNAHVVRCMLISGALGKLIWAHAPRRKTPGRGSWAPGGSSPGGAPP